MPLRINTFTKILSLIVILLIPIIVLYWFSNRTSLEVVRTEVEKSMYKDLSFFASKTDEMASQISKNGLLVSEDMNVRALEYIETANLYEQTNEKQRIDEKLRLLNASSPWDTTISLYAPDTATFVSTNPSLEYDAVQVERLYSRGWRYTTSESAHYRSEPRFVRFITEPYDTTIANAGLIVQISFSAGNLAKTLDKFKEGGKGDPLLVTPDDQLIQTSTANNQLQRQLLQSIDLQTLTKQQSTRIKLLGKEYIVSCAWMPVLSMYLLDYVPIHDVVQPITTSSYMFYWSILILLLFSIPVAYLLYTNVQVPIRELIRGVRKLKRGEYPKLNVFKANHEFHFLLVSFNEMAAQIEQLIQNVYLETIRSRDANLKQLQSQINPHFLYNCFTLIRSLTRLGEKESVMQLALHLSKYYRYTTRSEKQTAYLREELELVGSYLAIQAMNVQDLQYEIDIPETMLELELPRLIIQPMVENAVIHGIEPLGGGLVRVYGSRNDRYHLITISDNGKGVDEGQLASLNQQLCMPPSEDKGCALWNTLQRMQLQYGPDAGLRILRGKEGGLVIELYWPHRQEFSRLA